MIVYKTRWFDRWANKQGLTSPSLCAAVREMTEGLYDADLGNGLLKNELRDQAKGREAAFAHWSPPTKETVGYSYLVSQKTNVATSTKMKR